MRLFLTSLIFSFFCSIVNAQQDRFIYLQAENNQSFTVKLNNRLYNSFPLGYLIIPKLDEGIYNLVIRFPESPNQQGFNCSISENDAGFIIKNTGDQWQLYNVQTRAVTLPAEVMNKTEPVYEKLSDPFSLMLANAVHDSTILRKDAREVVEKPNQNDSSALVLNINTAVKPDSSITDSAVTALTANAVNENKPQQSDTAMVKVSPEVTVTKGNVNDTLNNAVADSKIAEKKDSVITVSTTTVNPADTLSVSDVAKVNTSGETVPKESIVITPVDSTQNSAIKEVVVTKTTKKKKSRKDENALKDTVTENVSVPVVNKDSSSVVPVSTAYLRSVIKRRSRKNGKEGMEMVYIDDTGEGKDTIRLLIPVDKIIKDADKNRETVSEPVVEKKTDTVVQVKPDFIVTKDEKDIIKEANSQVKVTMVNSDCKNFATDEDFLKARKKMVAEDNDEDMVKAAKKIFKTRCFTTEQIRNLSVLFLKDDGKYIFFDAAYPFVSDTDRFSELEKQLTVEYYINRFRAMIRK